jgi:hypothetical protein
MDDSGFTLALFQLCGSSSTILGVSTISSVANDNR